jgi:polysaccharide export outer membrane protein
MIGRILLAACVAFGSLSAGGCAMMPAAGPESWDVRAGQGNPESLPYALVHLTVQTEAVLAASEPKLVDAFTDRRAATDIHFGVGDVVGVTLFESAAGGLFIPLEAGARAGNFVTLPNQSVDSNGNISIPYAGAVHAKGRTVIQVQNAIVDALKGRALEPQAVVALVDQRASSISVLGDVTSSGRFPTSASGERILDALARAGGPRSQGFDELVTLEREGRRATVPFGALVYEPANNIYVRPQDTLFLSREPQTFVGFGASGTQGQFNFDAWRLTLAEAVAKMSGLNDNLADPASVFIYRGEARQVAQRLGVDVAKFEGTIIPIIYNVSFRDPAGYFLATKFQMRNKDVVYTSNSFSVESSKVLQYLLLLGSVANTPVNTGIDVFTLRNLSHGAGSSAAIVTTTPVAP